MIIPFQSKPPEKAIPGALFSIGGGSRAKPQKFTLHRDHYDNSILIYGVKWLWNNPWKSDCTGRGLSFFFAGLEMKTPGDT